jgi:hypothetical protein
MEAVKTLKNKRYPKDTQRNTYKNKEATLRCCLSGYILKRHKLKVFAYDTIDEP